MESYDAKMTEATVLKNKIKLQQGKELTRLQQVLQNRQNASTGTVNKRNSIKQDDVKIDIKKEQDKTNSLGIQESDYSDEYTHLLKQFKAKNEEVV